MRRRSKKRQEQQQTPEGWEYENLLQLTTKPWCWACGADPPVERAHLAAGSGKMMRIEDRKGVVLLCGACHRLHRHTRPKTCICEPLTDANTIWLKRERDPEAYDPIWIKNVWIGIPPEPMEPIWLRELYKSRRLARCWE